MNTAVNNNDPLKSENDFLLNELAVDCVVFGYNQGSLEVLLVKEDRGSGFEKWGLPSCFVKIDQSIEKAVLDLLHKFNIEDNIFCEQLKTFYNPQKQQFRRVLAIGYYALIKIENFKININTDLPIQIWTKIEDVPDLIYNHNAVLDFAFYQLGSLMRQSPIALNLLPDKFTLLELMGLYEGILGLKTDESNFRKKMLKKKLLLPLDEKKYNTSHRQARLYRFDSIILEDLGHRSLKFDF